MAIEENPLHTFTIKLHSGATVQINALETKLDVAARYLTFEVDSRSVAGFPLEAVDAWWENNVVV